MKKISRIKLVEEAIDLFLEYRDEHGFSEEQAKDKAIAEIQEYEGLEFDSTEQDREIAELRVERDWAQDAETLMSDCRKAAEARADKAEAEVERLLSYVDGNDKDVEIGDLETRVKELEELLGEETYAERAAVRHYKRIKELEEGLGECCRMFEWCDVRYGRLLAEKEKV